jgi:hypothetical protein
VEAGDGSGQDDGAAFAGVAAVRRLAGVAQRVGRVGGLREEGLRAAGGYDGEASG